MVDILSIIIDVVSINVNYYRNNMNTILMLQYQFFRHNIGYKIDNTISIIIDTTISNIIDRTISIIIDTTKLIIINLEQYRLLSKLG